MKLKFSLKQISKSGYNLTNSCLNLIDSLSKPKLKVALISYYYQNPLTSGVGIHVQNLAKNLVKHDCEVHVFCNSQEEEFFRENGVVVHGMGKVNIPVKNSFSKKRLEYELFESEVIKSFIRENLKKSFDIVHTHGSLTKAAFILRKIFDFKWIHTFHAIEKLRIKELSQEEKGFSDLISWIETTTNHSDANIFVSYDLMKNASKHYLSKSKLMISNGVDTSFFKFTPIKNKNVLFIGRFSTEKGIGDILKIIEPIMGIEGSSFTIVAANKNLEGELKKIRDKFRFYESKYSGRLNFINEALTPDQIKELYRNCQIYIQPSSYESFGLCILEAMASGRPVISYNVGGIPEVMGDAGFIVSNLNELIYKLKFLLDNKEEASKIGLLANERSKNFDWEQIAKKTLDYYKHIKNG